MRSPRSAPTIRCPRSPVGLARSPHDRRIPQVRGLPGLEARRRRQPLDHPERAHGRGGQRLRQHPGRRRGNFPPGAWSFTGVIDAIVNMADANAVAYKAIKRKDRNSRSASSTTWSPSRPPTRTGQLTCDRRGTPSTSSTGCSWRPRSTASGTATPTGSSTRRAQPQARQPRRLRRAQLLLPRPHRRPGHAHPAHTAAGLPAQHPVRVGDQPAAPRRVPRPARSSAGRSTPRACARCWRSPATIGCR